MKIENFRDMAKFNDKLKDKFIFRSSALCLIGDKNITTIIDLRADRELKEFDYSAEFKNNFNVVHTPFDPWEQSIEFQNTHNSGTNVEIAYKFFSYECKQSIKKVITTILDAKNAIAIHCHAGKDRTGIFFTILHMLVDASEDVIYKDYLASKMDTKKEYIDIFIDIVEKEGGIRDYLKSCDLSDKQINNLKNKVGV